MRRYDSGEVPLPPIAENADSGELIFYGVERRGASYEARVFVNNRQAALDTPRELADGYAGRFTVFGHGGCVGDSGHCDHAVEEDPAFELRLPQGLPGITKTVPLSAEAVRRLQGDTFTVTVIAAGPSDNGPVASDEMGIESWRLATYEP